jgi:ethanolamine ammonia-lyase small subunit
VEKPKSIEPDPWQGLKVYTEARIALGHTGGAIPLAEVLRFRLAHAQAKDAVYSQLDYPHLQQGLDQLGLPYFSLHSQADTRARYLQRPDWGRKLAPDARARLLAEQSQESDLALVLADGLSATAINLHAIPVLKRLVPGLQEAGFQLAPLCLVSQARVAIGDEIGQCLGAKMVLLLIGERPGLSSPYSMGAYLTYAPSPGLTDERRNCVSNIRPEGLPYAGAVQKIRYLIQEALRLRLSGVDLKDNGEEGHLLG